MSRVRVVGYIDTGELTATVDDGTGRVSADAFEEIRTFAVGDLDDLEAEVEG